MNSGKELLSEIASNTGLPEELMSKELGSLVSRAGLDSNIVTLDDLRRVLADYCQEVLLAAKAEHEGQPLKTAAGE